MNDEYYKDDPVIHIRPSHIRKQLKPPFKKEFGYFSPKLLNKEPVPSGREGYYLYYYMESYQTSRTEKRGKKSVRIYTRHTSKKSVEVTLEQWNALHEKDDDDYTVNRREEEKLEYEPVVNGRKICTLDALLSSWDKFDHESFWINAFDLERVLNSFSDEDLDIYLYAKEQHLKQKQIAAIIGKSEAYVTRRMKFIEDAIEWNMIDDGSLSPHEIKAELEYRKYMRTGKSESFIDVYLYDFLLQMPQEILLRYLFIFRGQKYLIRFCFRWLCLYAMDKDRPKVNARETLNKYSFQLYKKYAVKLKTRSQQLFIAVELELDRLVKQYGLRDSRPNEKFIKAVEKAAKRQKMTVAEYRDRILFPHGKERIITRFKQFIKKYPELEGKGKPPVKNNQFATAMRNFVNRKRR